MQSKEWEVILNVMALDAENESQYSLRHGLLRHNYSWGRWGVWCDSRSVNVQFDINLATYVTAGRG